MTVYFKPREDINFGHRTESTNTDSKVLLSDEENIVGGLLMTDGCFSFSDHRFQSKTHSNHGTTGAKKVTVGFQNKIDENKLRKEDALMREL